MYTFKECQQIIENELKKISLPKLPIELYQPIRYALNSGGKRIRPALVLMACNLFSDDISQAINPALAIEIFHNFTLLHDDIMDKSEVRRNKPTVYKKWNENIAILSGDAMMIKAYELLAKSSPDKIIDIFQLFTKTALEVCEGQQYDMNFEEKNKVSVSEYLKMIELKTAVLIATSLKMGAIIGNADEKNANTIYEFGKDIGLAFQLQDDYLDVYGERQKFGKSLGNDIINNKKTFLLISALSIADKKTYNEMIYWMKLKKFDKQKKIDFILNSYKTLEIKNITLNQINKYFNRSKLNLHKISIQNARKTVIQDFSGIIMKREQ